jgi:D-amino-acid dehydrogenase
MSSGNRVIIVGAGVIGLCAAYYAQHRGLSVTVIDRRSEDGDGCSFGNAGMVVPSHFIPLAAPGMVALGLRWMWNPESPFYIQPRFSRDLATWGWRFWRAATRDHVSEAAPLLRDLNFASRDCFAELSSLDFGLERRGLLMLCRTNHGLDDEAETASMARQLDIPAEVLDASQIAALEPGIEMNVAGGVYYPKDCHLNPRAFMMALQRELERKGATFHWDTEITGWSTDAWKLKAVRTRHDEIAGDEFVLSGGSWSTELARELRISLPMQAGKGYSLTMQKPRVVPNTCAILTEARVAVTPINGALRFGGTMELAGMDERINPRRIAGIVRSVSEYYPQFSAQDFTQIPPWRGLRPCSPDGLPYLGRTVYYDNLIIATGHAMMGLSLGPVSGQIVANILTGEPTGFDLRMLSPDRYA